MLKLMCLFDKGEMVVSRIKWRAIDSAPKDGTVILARLVFESDGAYAGAHTIKWRDTVGYWCPSLVAVSLKLADRHISQVPVSWQRIPDKREHELDYEEE